MNMLTQRDIQAALLKVDVDPSQEPQFWDTYYAPIKSEWLMKAFTAAWIEYKEQLGLDYRSERFDCDDFALTCWTYMRFLHAKTGFEDVKAGIAFGFYGYVNATTFGPHAINVAITEVGPLWFEPQTSVVVNIEKAERQTCKFYAF